ncbi:SsgA family sporulation/cell division regulator [Kitasatospora azatica]|uniref:SsgA family sporulation/cell division regulator n=1 Tax=Kitasatospora azatica TaxID=58347 RepID=UPI001E46E228|nr:SsgA family sporulation/cell division regulator [Kitasatospora azatica]
MVTVHVIGPDEVPAPLPSALYYDIADPYAVRLSLGAPSAQPVDWVFARSLLTEGLRRPTGSGDVLVIPRPASRRDFVRIVLRSPEGTAMVDIDESALAAFLRRTLSLVPAGTESLHLDLDRVLAELTGRLD